MTDSPEPAFIGMYWTGAGLPFEARLAVPATHLGGLRARIIAAVDHSHTVAALHGALLAAANLYSLELEFEVVVREGGGVAAARLYPSGWHASGLMTGGRTMDLPRPAPADHLSVDGPRTERRALMHAFIVTLENAPGTLATVTEAIAAKGVDLATGAGFALDTRGGFAFIANDEAGARSALDGAGITYREIEIVPATVENRPGGLAEVARRLADAGINVELAIPTGMAEGKVTIAIGTADPERARSVLGSSAAVTA